MTFSILIIDDDPAVRYVCRRVLEANGFVTIQAENGREGMKLLHDASPNLVISDLIMPEMEGLETIMEIRKTRPDLRIIVVSGGARIANVNFLEMALLLGANEAIAKPFGPDELLRSVRRQLMEGGQINHDQSPRCANA